MLFIVLLNKNNYHKYLQSVEHIKFTYFFPDIILFFDNSRFFVHMNVNDKFLTESVKPV